MHSLIRPEGTVAGHLSVPGVTAAELAAGGGGHAAAPAPGLLEVLWRRRWTLALTVLACLSGAAVYLTLATPVYLATARVAVEQNGPRATADVTGYQSQSESFLPTEADVFLSMPVLRRATERLNWRAMKSFATAAGDPAGMLRRGGALKTEVSHKADVIVVSMESPYATEAVDVVAAVVDAYTVEQATAKKSSGGEIVRALQAQRDQLLARRDACTDRMLKAKQDHGVLSFKDDATNDVLAKASALSRTLTDAEIATIDLRSQQDAIKRALADPRALSTFVEAQQIKVKESGDHEYDELRSQLGVATLSLTTARELQGPNHPRVQMFQQVADTLRARLAAKERQMADAQLLAISTQVGAAEDKERQLRAALEAHQSQALGLNPAALAYARAEAEATQLQKQVDLLEARIGEVSVNTIEAKPLNVRVIDPARAEAKPIKPNKSMVMAIALMAGGVLGMGLGILREWQDARLRKPEEIQALLGTAVIATVPRINARLSPSVRGQIVRLDGQSPVAEAYRSVRTALYLGTSREARTVLVASPAQGDGKSTTASNLAIAFAQAGDRVLLIDCDLHNPVQHHVFEMEGAEGLSSVMAGQAKLREAIRPTCVPNLHLLAGGPLPQNPSELLSGRKFKRLMQVLSNTFDRIVIDSPPLMRFNDGRILAASADVTLLVLRMNQSVRALGMVAMERLAQVGANVIGAVANDVPADGSRYYYYGNPWQYARRTGGASSGDWAPPVKKVEASPVTESAPREGEALAATFESGRVKTDMLAIAEPDWSSDGDEA